MSAEGRDLATASQTLAALSIVLHRLERVVDRMKAAEWLKGIAAVMFVLVVLAQLYLAYVLHRATAALDRLNTVLSHGVIG